MQQFLVQRVGLALFALIGLSILTFALVRSHYWGYYEEPSVVVQYGSYVNDLLRGNWERPFGVAWDARSSNEVLERLPATLRLASFALAVGTALGISLGVLAAINRGSIFGRWADRVFSLVQATPVFWVAISLVGVAAYLPVRFPVGTGDGFTHLILPAVTLALLPAAVIAKLVRSAMVTALESEYVKLARIKGVAEWKIIWKHCLRNVAVSPLISFGLVGGSFMTALVLTEVAFQWPGAGLLMLRSMSPSGYDLMLSGVVLVLAGGFILCHLIYDVVRAFLDPRIRYSEGAVPCIGAGY